MINSTHTAPSDVARSLVSDRPRGSKYELDPRACLYQENLVLREEVGLAVRLEEIVGCSEPSNRGLEHVTKLASTDATVLISAGTQVPRRSPCGKLQRRLLQRVLDRMKTDLATVLDVNTLAAESGYSRSHFLRTFRAVMGCLPHQCLTRLRVEQAKTILRATSCSLTSPSIVDFPATRTFAVQRVFANLPEQPIPSNAHWRSRPLEFRVSTSSSLALMIRSEKGSPSACQI